MKSMGYELRLVAHFGFWSKIAILEQALPPSFFDTLGSLRDCQQIVARLAGFEVAT
jgi:hypothetical protein